MSNPFNLLYNALYMDLNDALFFMGLDPSPSREELETSFRRLVMVYHPDKNPEKAAWSHDKMSLLNEAHDIVERHISAPQEAATVQPPPRETALRMQKIFEAARGSLLDGMHLYYTFDLQNIHLRMEGNRKFHYNSARRSIKKAIIQFDKLAEECPESNFKTRLLLYNAFGKSFFACMGITSISPTDNSPNYKAFRYYRNASLIIDALIRLIFFPEDFPRPADLCSKSIELCEQELLLIQSNYRDTDWGPEAGAKLELLDNLRELARFENRW